MSLESQISDLVLATNNLITEVANKQAGIDQKVTAAIAAIPSFDKTLYVDAIAGVDTAAGTSDAPMKTVAAAINRVPLGGRGVILLRKGQTHTMNTQLHVPNKVIWLRQWEANVINPSAPDPDSAVLRLVQAPAGASTTTIYGSGSAVLIGGYSLGIRVEGAGDNTGKTLISASEGYGGRWPMHLSIAYSALSLDGVYLFSGNDLHTHGVTLTIANSAKLYELTGRAGRFHMGSLTLPAGVNLPDLFTGVIKDAAGALRNLAISSNVAF